MSFTIHQGDAIEKLRELPEASAHCCITSPPYYGLRSYLPDVVQLDPRLDEQTKAIVMEQLKNLGVFPLDHTSD